MIRLDTEQRLISVKNRNVITKVKDSETPIVMEKQDKES